MTLELDASGLSTQTQDEIVAQISARLRAVFGNNLVTDIESIIGQILAIFCEFNALNQQTILSVYQSFDPNSAIGVALDRVCAITGTRRKSSAPSTVVGVLTFASAGTMAVGDLIRNDSNQTIWELTSGPHTSAGPWPEEIAATFSAVVDGPTLANAGTVWTAITSVPGLTGFTNPDEDATPGRLQEGDPALRKRRITERYAANIGARGAIAAVISQVPGVELVRVYHNPSTYPVDVEGVPFKAFNVVVRTAPNPPTSAIQQAIADALLTVLGAGGEAYGTDYDLTSTDSEGQTVTGLRFDLVVDVNVFVKITLGTTGTEERISENLAATVAAEVLEYANENFVSPGRDVLGYRVGGIVDALRREGAISGVTGVTVELSTVGLSGPYTTNISIGQREQADFDTVNIQVVVTP